jgi:hypothetical protein
MFLLHIIIQDNRISYKETIKKDFRMIKKKIEPFPSAIGPGDGWRGTTGVDSGGGDIATTAVSL